MWPFRRRTETRATAGNGGGDFFDAVLDTIHDQAARQSADAGGTAAIEAAAGQLARAFAAARPRGAQWAQRAISPMFLAQVGRDLIRGGQSMHRIDLDAGAVVLTPVAQWHWQAGQSANPSGWRAQVTDYGPSGSRTDWLPYDGLVWLPWGLSTSTPWVGQGPARFAAHTAKLSAETERAIADEAAGSVAQLIPVPDQGPEGDDIESDDSDADPHEQLRGDLRSARTGANRGRTMLMPTTAAAWGEGPMAAPRRDWVPARLGPNPPAELVEVARDSFARMLAACGSNVSLFAEADGTAQREALRRWHMGTVLPLAALLEAELSAKLETPVVLDFDRYPLDIVGRASALKALVAAGASFDSAARELQLDLDAAPQPEPAAEPAPEPEPVA